MEELKRGRAKVSARATTQNQKSHKKEGDNDLHVELKLPDREVYDEGADVSAPELGSDDGGEVAVEGPTSPLESVAGG